jgi:hypothetical protein
MTARELPKLTGDGIELVAIGVLVRQRQYVEPS